MKIHESNLKDPRLLNLVKSMGYTLVGFNMDECNYKYNTAATPGQIAEVFNAMFTKQMDAFCRRCKVLWSPRVQARSKVGQLYSRRGSSPVAHDGKTSQDATTKSAGSRFTAVTSVLAIVPALVFAYLL
ncbi:hypothetical protein BGX29_007845 [Mortierella sp. GBA35]|nr:hypothetical protein BGX29_007845 [Mortierella sp. GBA35]